MRYRGLRWVAASIAVLLLAGAVYCGTVLYSGHLATGRVLAEARGARDLSSMLPRHWRASLLTVEDPQFESHSGVDLATPGAGLTTITQSLVKWHYFGQFVPGWRKIPQTLLAFLLDRSMSKREQLNLFLDTAYLGSVGGRAVRGFEDAAETFYRKELLALSDQEFLALVAVLIAPDELNPLQNPVGLNERVARIRRLIAGDCAPEGLTDVFYRACATP